MLRAWDNLQFQFLGKTDFGSVIAVHRNAFEDFPEIALQLLVGWLNMISMMGASYAARERHIVNGTQLRDLLVERGIDKILAEEFLALLINILESLNKMGALL